MFQGGAAGGAGGASAPPYFGARPLNFVQTECTEHRTKSCNYSHQYFCFSYGFHLLYFVILSDQGCTIAIEFAKITEHFLNLLNSIVIEPRLVSKWKKSEGRYCYWYWTSCCVIIEFTCVIEILSLCILLLKLRLKCHFSSSTIATEIEKLLCAYCYWSWDWIAPFPHPQLQPELKSYCV